MFDIKNNTFHFSITPYERVADQKIDLVTHSWDCIKTWIEFSLSGVKIQYKTEFTVGELKPLKVQLTEMYNKLSKQAHFREVNFIAERRQLSLLFRQQGKDAVEVVFVLYPEDNAESVQIKGNFGIDESYFPALLSGLDAMINWQN